MFRFRNEFTFRRRWGGFGFWLSRSATQPKTSFFSSVIIFSFVEFELTLFSIRHAFALLGRIGRLSLPAHVRCSYFFVISKIHRTILIFASLRTICSKGDCAYLRFAPNDCSQGDCAFREGTAVLEFLHKDWIFIVTCGKNSRYNHFLRELFARFKK